MYVRHVVPSLGGWRKEGEWSPTYRCPDTNFEIRFHLFLESSTLLHHVAKSQAADNSGLLDRESLLPVIPSTRLRLLTCSPGFLSACIDLPRRCALRGARPGLSYLPWLSRNSSTRTESTFSSGGSSHPAHWTAIYPLCTRIRHLPPLAPSSRSLLPPCLLHCACLQPAS